MKIISWNINGLRAGLRKQALHWVWEQGPEIVCLQEIRARPDQLTEEQSTFPGYETVWNPARRPGYSGVATIVREAVQEFTLGMDSPLFDVEGRLISTRHPGFRLFNVYFPNSQRSPERLDYKLDFYAHLLELCDGLHLAGEHLIITGDFNTAHTALDLKNAAQNKRLPGFLPVEREWVQRFLDHGFVDAYRRLYPDRIQYTWWSNRFSARQRGIGWRIDYFLVSEALVQRVRDVVIHDEVAGSDHCPVELILA